MNGKQTGARTFSRGGSQLLVIRRKSIAGDGYRWISCCPGLHQKCLTPSLQTLL